MQVMVSEQFISVVQGLDNYDILCRHLLANITLFNDDRVSCYITLAGFTVVLFLSHLVSRSVIIFGTRSKVLSEVTEDQVQLKTLLKQINVNP